jgi:ketosteroid isomerase-like protein
MSNLRVDVLARRYLETLGAGQIRDCLNLFAEEAVLIFPASITGARSLGKKEFGAMQENAPNVFESWPLYTLTHQTTEGDRSCIEFLGSGRMKNGAAFQNQYCIVFVADAGVIVEMREYLDTSALLAAAKPVSS